MIDEIQSQNDEMSDLKKVNETDSQSIGPVVWPLSRAWLQG